MHASRCPNRAWWRPLDGRLYRPTKPGADLPASDRTPDPRFGAGFPFSLVCGVAQKAPNSVTIETYRQIHAAVATEGQSSAVALPASVTASVEFRALSARFSSLFGWPAILATTSAPPAAEVVGGSALEATAECVPVKKRPRRACSGGKAPRDDEDDEDYAPVLPDAPAVKRPRRPRSGGKAPRDDEDDEDYAPVLPNAPAVKRPRRARSGGKAPRDDEDSGPAP